jgi:hypothetical protein
MTGDDANSSQWDSGGSEQVGHGCFLSLDSHKHLVKELVRE